MKVKTPPSSTKAKEQNTKEAKTLLEQIAECFESGKYEESRLMADEFIKTRPKTELNSRLYEPFGILVRRSMEEAIRVTKIFCGYGYENWVEYYMKENGKLNKAGVRK